MRNQARNVTGGEQVLSNFIPGMGLMNYVLGWIAVVPEVFLRRDFGERYFTRPNFIAGFIVLVAWSMFGSLLSFIGNLPIISFFVHHGNKAGVSVSWMPTVMKWYFIFGFIHFAFIWFRNVVGDPVHSFSAGRSWLRPIGQILIGFMNLFLNAALRLVIQMVPKYKDRLNDNLSVIQDVDVFTERFIEPLFVFIMSVVIAGMGQPGLAWLMIFSVMALNYTTGQRHRADRNALLDIRDQMIEARFMREAMSGKKNRGANRVRRMVNDAAKEVRKSPEAFDILKKQNPSLADAVEAFEKARIKRQGGDGNTDMTMAA